MTTKKILIAFGGISPEHEVSVLTAIQAIAALEKTNAVIIPLYIAKNGKWYTGQVLKTLQEFKDIPALLSKCSPCTFKQDDNGKVILVESESGGFFKKPLTFTFDVVLISFHGSDGENGSFQGLCETFNLPYTGSGVLGSSMGMDKFTAKTICRAHQIPVVPDVCFYEFEWVSDQKNLITQMETLGYPLFVKPVSLGSSIGVSKAKDRTELLNRIENAFRYDRQLLVERSVDPLMEINCSVLGTEENAEASVLEHPKASKEVLTFEDKYLQGDSTKGMASADRIIPAPVDAFVTKEIQQLSVTIFKKFHCNGVARLDFLRNADTGEIFFNEINTIPGSFSFYLWEHSGLNFERLLVRLLDLAIERHRLKNGRVRMYETNLLSEKAVKGLKQLKGLKK
jgi:D-alanine-D-alanine ligase